MADAYDFNDHAYRRFVERLKVCFADKFLDIADLSRIPSIRMGYCHLGSKGYGQRSIGISEATCDIVMSSPAGS